MRFRSNKYNCTFLLFPLDIVIAITEYRSFILQLEYLRACDFKGFTQGHIPDRNRVQMRKCFFSSQLSTLIELH